MYLSWLKRGLLTWKARVRWSLSSQCIVSSGRSTRCSELVEMATSSRHRSSSIVGSVSPLCAAADAKWARLREREPVMAFVVGKGGGFAEAGGRRGICAPLLHSCHHRRDEWGVELEVSELCGQCLGLELTAAACSHNPVHAGVDSAQRAAVDAQAALQLPAQLGRRWRAHNVRDHDFKQRVDLLERRQRAYRLLRLLRNLETEEMHHGESRGARASGARARPGRAPSRQATPALGRR